MSSKHHNIIIHTLSLCWHVKHLLVLLNSYSVASYITIADWLHEISTTGYITMYTNLNDVFVAYCYLLGLTIMLTILALFYSEFPVILLHYVPTPCIILNIILKIIVNTIQKLSKWYLIAKHDYSIGIMITTTSLYIIMCWPFYSRISFYSQSPFEKSGCLLTFLIYFC